MKLGDYQRLVVVKEVSFGVYLAEDGKGEKGSERVLLPRLQVPEGTREGDEIEVFLYRDSKDRLIATTNRPLLSMGEVALLRVAEVGDIGAFLSWGLERDLFLPFREMTRRIKPGDEVLVRLYIDKSKRLCATMKKLYELLSTDSPYKEGDAVRGRIYEFGHDFGTFVAVDDKYSAMIPAHEDVSGYEIGDVVDARVLGVKPDGKLDVTLREKAYLQMDSDAERVMGVIESYGGALPFTEKSSPEVIKKETGLSKSAFKRAVGRLYKERRVAIDGETIRAAKK